jgi:hypothetical protein
MLQQRQLIICLQAASAVKVAAQLAVKLYKLMRSKAAA